jgi:hypothetical protein
MTSISFEEHIDRNKSHFKTLEEFQMYIFQNLQKSDLSDAHKIILDDRLKDAQQYPDSFITLKEVKSSFRKS